MSSGYFQVPQPMRSDGAGGIDKGPRDIMRDLENPDMLVPPTTDAGLIPNLRFSFSDTHMTLNQGGWSREITVRELPIATTMAGVNMSLTPGAYVSYTGISRQSGLICYWGTRVLRQSIKMAVTLLRM